MAVDLRKKEILNRAKPLCPCKVRVGDFLASEGSERTFLQWEFAGGTNLTATFFILIAKIEDFCPESANSGHQSGKPQRIQGISRQAKDFEAFSTQTPPLSNSPQRNGSQSGGVQGEPLFLDDVAGAIPGPFIVP
jgi:hypothetical protein